jgi:hypothetical protein
MTARPVTLSYIIECEGFLNFTEVISDDLRL